LSGENYAEGGIWADIGASQLVMAEMAGAAK